MGHLLSTMNPQAAEDADSGWKPAGPPLTDPSLSAADTLRMADVERAKEWLSENEDHPHPDGAIPSIGHVVVYHLRDGDSRNRRIKFPAIVMDSDLAAGTLKLWVIVDDGDTWMQDHVPVRVAPEPGWELVNQGPDELSLNVARLGDRVADLEAKLATPMVAELSWAQQNEILKLIKRIEALEAKRGPGRPAKIKDE